MIFYEPVREIYVSLLSERFSDGCVCAWGCGYQGEGVPYNHGNRQIDSSSDMEDMNILSNLWSYTA